MSGAVLTVSASMIVERPIDLVRKQFADIDHAVRDGVCEDLVLRWASPTKPGERRLTQGFRVLAVMYDDEVVFEAEPAGDVTRTVVGGPNAGGEFRDTFAPVGEGRTRVTSFARLPANRLRAAVAPFFRLALKVALTHILEAHKADIEGDYQPGKARGNVKAAISDLGAVVERARACTRDADRIALVTPLIESACVVAIADEEVDDAERDAIRAVTDELGMRMLQGDALDAIVASSVDRTRAAGIDRRCDELGARLKALDLAQAGLSIAATVALVSHGLDQRELVALERLARAADIDEDVLTAVIERVDQRLDEPTG